MPNGGPLCLSSHSTAVEKSQRTADQPGLKQQLGYTLLWSNTNVNKQRKGLTIIFAPWAYKLLYAYAETQRSKLAAPMSRHRIRVGIVYIVSIKCIT